MDKKEQKLIIIGAPKPYTPESIKRQCYECKTVVWIQPWNDDKIPSCFPCALKVVKKGEGEFRVQEKDLLRASDILKHKK